MRRAFFVSFILPILLISCGISQNTTESLEESEVRSVVEDFGRRLKAVSLRSPCVQEEMQEQYSELVSPELLQQWMGDAMQAPGRIVSSPWPDRIEITSVVQETYDEYRIAGYVVEVTSAELISGEALNRMPVRMTVERGEDGWVITEYSQY